jgi:photosystem II stability/assembly factor-like uncharacterized protein
VATYGNALAFSGAHLFAGTDSGVFRTEDNGKTWIPENNGLTNINVISLLASGGELFAGCHGGDLFRSADNGEHWTQINEGLTCATTYVFAVDGDRLFAGTASSGVWSRPIPELTNSISNRSSPKRVGRSGILNLAGIEPGIYGINGKKILPMMNPARNERISVGK